MRAARMLASSRPRRCREHDCQRRWIDDGGRRLRRGSGAGGAHGGPPPHPGRPLGGRARGAGPGRAAGSGPRPARDGVPGRHGCLLRRPAPRPHARAGQGDGRHHVHDVRRRRQRARHRREGPPLPGRHPADQPGGAAQRGPGHRPHERHGQEGSRGRALGRAQGGRVGRPVGAGLAQRGATCRRGWPATSSRRRCGPASPAELSEVSLLNWLFLVRSAGGSSRS